MFFSVIKRAAGFWRRIPTEAVRKSRISSRSPDRRDVYEIPIADDDCVCCRHLAVRAEYKLCFGNCFRWNLVAHGGLPRVQKSGRYRGAPLGHPLPSGGEKWGPARAARIQGGDGLVAAKWKN